MQNWLQTSPIAHRGIHSGDMVIPENSMKAFEAAVLKNHPIELDLHVISDGTVIVFHDDNLVRMCGIQKSTDLLTKDDLPNCYLKGSNESIPTLSQVLEFVDGRVPLLIEIKKTNATSNGNERIYTILKAYPHLFAIQSFNPFILGWFARNAQTMIRGQLSSGYRKEKMFFLQKIILRNYLCNFISKPNFIAHNINDLPSKKVESLRKKGMILLGWTVHNKEESVTARHYCDNVIFEGFEFD